MIRAFRLFFGLSLLVVTIGLAGACRSHRGERFAPYVQPSSPAAPNAFVTVTSALQFVPGCVEISPGDTIEWTSQTGGIPIDVTSIGEPLELYSPTLVPPASCGTPNQTCWRHTFARSGCYEYFDTNSGTLGRPVRDPYYGTITYVGQSGNVTRALVCADPSGRCPGICCQTRADCPASPSTTYECISRRCVDVATNRAIDCSGYSAASPGDGGAP